MKRTLILAVTVVAIAFAANSPASSTLLLEPGVRVVSRHHTAANFMLAALVVVGIGFVLLRRRHADA